IGSGRDGLLAGRCPSRPGWRSHGSLCAWEVSMAPATGGPPEEPSGWTVGSLLGLPLGVHDVAPPPVAPATGAPLSPTENEGPGWTVRGGEARVGLPPAGIRAAGVEALDYNNPFAQNLERVWFDGKLVYALDCGPVDVDPQKVRAAQEYQLVYDVA